MPLNTFTLGLTIRDLPEFCGPDDLSDGIKSIRESDFGGTAYSSPISNEGLRRLIKLAYYTSFAAEEGRYPRFRLMNTGHGAVGSIWRAADFNTPINDVESLRRLAPAASETHGALLITERDGALLCTGSVVVSDFGLSTKIGRPEMGGVGRSPSLIVRVDGPGRLRATERFTLVLDRARIRQVVDYGLVRQIEELWGDLAAQIVAGTTRALGAETQKYFPGGPEQFIHKAWSRVLATALDRHHGGAFVVLPTTEQNPEEFDIHCKYPAQLDFGDLILQFWQSCIRHATAKGVRELGSATHAWTWRRAAVFDKAGILAGLSSVDGCVVLNRKLQVLGFGGEIQVSEQQAQEATRTLKNLKTGEPEPEEDALKGLGTRHRSAYRLAKVHPGVIVFVISQDGDLRIFCSDESDVFGFDRLDAWVQEYESN